MKGKKSSDIVSTFAVCMAIRQIFVIRIVGFYSMSCFVVVVVACRLCWPALTNALSANSHNKLIMNDFVHSSSI